jgi:3-oxoacyl-[acyl-carrier-protein] synthase II
MTGIHITGIGVVSAIGVGKAAFWQGCRTARSGIRAVDGFLKEQHGSPLAGWVADFDPRRNLAPAVYRRMSRLSRMAASAGVEAFQDSGLDLSSIDRDRVAIVVGTAHGASASIEEFFVSLLAEGPRGAQPLHFPETVPNAPAGNLAMVLKITGPSTTFGQNEISAESALLYARRLLLDDQVDAAVVCGLDELNDMFFNCFDALGVLNPGRREKGAWLPLRGAGIVLGEGAGALVLERAEHAQRRGARRYARLAGGGCTSAPAATGTYEGCAPALVRAIREALLSADIDNRDLDQIVVSANFSGDLEAVEAAALERITGSTVWVTPLRYLTGSFGGAGILSTAALALSIHHQEGLPAIALETLTGRQGPPPWQMRLQHPLRNGLHTACTYGGGCAALIVTGVSE